MLKGIAFFFTLFFLFSLALACQDINIGSRTVLNTASSSKSTGTVTGCSSLRIRRTPNGKILGSLSKGDSVEVLGTSADNKWYKISHNGAEAYVSKAYITLNGQAVPTASSTAGSSNASTASASSKQNGYTTASSLTIRKAPWGTVLTRYKYGTQVVILEKVGDWYKISYQGGSAFAHSQYVKLGTPPASDPGNSTGGTLTSGPKSKRILDGINSLKSQTMNYPSACGARKNGKYYPGYYGCAYVVSLALKKAGINVYSLGVDDLSAKLQKKPDPGFRKVPASSRQPGDIIIWNPSHIGVVAGGGQAVSNSSTLGRVREHSSTYKTIRYVLRAPA